MSWEYGSLIRWLNAPGLLNRRLSATFPQKVSIVRIEFHYLSVLLSFCCHSMVTLWSFSLSLDNLLPLPTTEQDE